MSSLAVVRTLRDGPVVPGTINYGHLSPVTAVTRVDHSDGERRCPTVIPFQCAETSLALLAVPLHWHCINRFGLRSLDQQSLISATDCFVPR